MTLSELLAQFPRERTWLLPALQAVQRAERWLSAEALEAVAAHLRVPASEVWGVASHYPELRLARPGRRIVRVCTGLSCRAHGGRDLLGVCADRLAIRTYVTQFDEGTIREAILREVSRGGQVYFVHNRIQTIEKIRDRLRKMIPEVKIEVAHGQMNEDDLEEAMIGFMEKKFEVLLCTAIIESGLDIPSANTIIINRADHFGLAQLYQLRGRVGRSTHRAYAYLLVPHDELITDDAKKRLAVIQRFTELGSGFKIAEYDLEIRGAGNILGPEQSGMITAVGYDLYVSLLKQAVAELKGEQMEEEIDPELKLNISAYLPEDFIPETSLRLQLYKQLSMLEDELLCLNLVEEWTDRFGPLPIPAQNLIALMRIKIPAKKLRLSSVNFKDRFLTVQVHPSSHIPTDYFLGKVKKEPKKYRILPDGKFVIDTGKKSENQMFDAVRGCLEEMIDAMK